MNHRLKMFLLVSVMTTCTCLAQTGLPARPTIVDDGQWQKAITTHRLSQFPKIHRDGRVWFRFKAPQTAQSVRLHRE